MEKDKFQRTENPLLDEILQKYRDCSTDSISGPKGFGEHLGKKPWTISSDMKGKQTFVSSGESVKTARNQSVLRSVATRMHVTAKDQGTLKFKETLVDQIPLACFSYGGEKRLCFKDLVEKVLKGFTTQAINSARDTLQIFCPRCTPQQLEILKLAGVLPWSCTSAGLITKSDSFRLIGALTCSSFPRRNSRIFSVESLEVYHECFGGCVGTLEIESYTDPYAECVTCSQCDGVFSPRTFITHTHSSGEVHSCHWGFDSAHWRLYLMLCNDHPTLHVQMLWEMLTSKFTEGNNRRRFKREYEPENSDADYSYNSKESRTSPSFSGKKLRSESRDGSVSPKHKEPEERYVYCSNGVVTSCANGGDIICRRSAFRPWSPNGNPRQNGKAVEKGIAGSMSTIPPGSPARIFTPSTNPSMNTDVCNCASPSCSHRAQKFFRNCSPKSTSPSQTSQTSQKLSETISTPTSRDPMSLEKTAKDMLDVVNRDNHGWSSFEEAYCHLQNGMKVGLNSGKISISEEDIYQTLLRHSSNGDGDLPNMKELSSNLAKDLKEILSHNEKKLKLLCAEKVKVEDALATTKRENASRVEELYDDLRKSKKDLRLCQARYRDETHELKNRINSLEAELRRQKFDKEGSAGCGSSKESLEVLQQEVRDMSVKLEQKDSFCRELESELSSLHAWIKAQTYHPTSTILYGYRPHQPEPRTVIQSVQFVNGNSEKSTPKSNGHLRRDSSEEDV